MQTTNDRNKGSAASPNSTDGRPSEQPGQHGRAARRCRDRAGASLRRARPSGDHRRRPAAQDRRASRRAGRRDGAGATETARDMANRAAEQARSAMAKAGETAQDLANRAREQAAPAAQAVYDQGARAGEYVTRNVHEYPTTALLIAAAVGYGAGLSDPRRRESPGARTANSTTGPIDRPGPAADSVMTARTRRGHAPHRDGRAVPRSGRGNAAARTGARGQPRIRTAAGPARRARRLRIAPDTAASARDRLAGWVSERVSAGTSSRRLRRAGKQA